MAESEWAALREQVRQFGVYRTPHCDNPTTASVVNMMGGWEAMCNMARGSCHTAAKILSSCGSIATDKSKQCSLGEMPILKLAQSERMGCERLALHSPAPALPQ